MKRFHYILIVPFMLLLIGCSEDNEAWEPNSPLNTTSLMKQYANRENYEQFKTLFQEGENEERIKNMYDKVRGAVSDVASIDTYTIVTFDNGKSLLVHLTTKTSLNGEVYIQNIIEVPTDMVELIQEQ